MGPRWTLILGLVACVLILFVGFQTIRTGGEWAPFGWVLLVIGFLTLVGNFALMKMRR